MKRAWTTTVGGLIATGAAVGLARGPLDGNPPVLQMTTPPALVSGALDLQPVAGDPQGVELFVAVNDGGPVLIEPGWVLDTVALSDGPHTLTIIARDGSWRANETRRTVQFTVDNTPPALSVVVTPAAQGRTMAFFIATDEPADVRATLKQREPTLYPVGERVWRGLVGFPIRQPSLTVPLVVEATDPAGNTAIHEVPVTIEETEFARGGYIRIPPSVQRERDDRELVAAMRAERDATYVQEHPEQLWRGPMRLPVTGRKTSPFGKYRTYSDGQKSYHSGVDIANRLGTPVVSAADGIVLLAKLQPIFGNVVIVHHGQGVVTSYNHLDAIDVSVGDRVQAGDLLGRLGSTGQSTGPHLHWGLTIHGVAVDAEQWLETGFELTDDIAARLSAGMEAARTPSFAD